MGRTSDSTSSTESLPEQIEVGRVVGAHGLRGQLRVRADADGAELLHDAERVTLAADGAEAPAVEYEVAAVSPGRRGELRVALVGLRHRDAAEALRGRRVLLARDQLAALPEGEYYGHELVGCAVEGEDGTPLGTLREIWSTGAPDVLVVEAPDGRQHLVPAALLREVDVEGRRAVVELLPGLLDADAAAEPGAPDEGA
jgi:16S rRNA processing protein RimM